MCTEEKEAVLEFSPEPQPDVLLKPRSPTPLHTNAKAKVLPQIIVSIIVSLGYFNAGAVNGWTGAALTKLELDYTMGPTEFSLVVSAVTVGSMISCSFAGKVADILGRKRAIMSAGPLLICGWLFIGCSQTIHWVYLGRLLCGLATGFVLVPCQVFSSEINEKSLRGRFSSLQPLALTLGLLTSYALAGFIPWRTSCFCFVGTSAFMTMSIMLVPESPHWLLLKNKRSEARKSLQTLRGSHFDVEPELKDIEFKTKSVGVNCSYRELFKRRTLIPMVVCLYIHTIQQLTGGNIIMMYTSRIFKVANSSISPEMGTLYTGLVQLLSVCISILLVDRLGRRTLLAISSTSVGVVTLCLAVYFHRFSSGEEDTSWIPLATIIVIVFCYCLGCRSIPWIMSPELFNTSIRSRACSLGVVYNRTLNFIVVQAYPYLREHAGSHTVFYMFGTYGVVMGLLAFYFLPETKNQTLEQIQEFFEDKAALSKASRKSPKEEVV